MDLINDLFTTTTYDPDSLLSRLIQDRWGLFSKSVSYYNGVTDSITTITSSDIFGDSSWSEIDTGDGAIKLKRSETDDLGRETITWSRGYGSIRMLYDKAGRLRFMQNDQRLTDEEFVYFKYDKFGRKIEEGIKQDALGLLFSQIAADNPDFPTTGVEVKYRWYYDYLPGQAPSGSIGGLVRTENADSSYFKEFFYDPLNFKDSVFIKLPITGGATKKVVHVNNFDGSRDTLRVYPDSATTTGERKMTYHYDEAGRLNSISRKWIAPDGMSLNFSEYTYNANGSVSQERIGVYTEEQLFDTIFDTVQVIDYSYSPLGQLIKINDTGTTVGVGSGGGGDSDHVSLDLQFYDGTSSTYANGRPKSLVIANSTQLSGKLIHDYDYTYNDLGWLTFADHQADNSHDRKYFYNPLGMRERLIAGTDTTDYDYDANWRFLGFDGVTAQRCKYDALGNLVEDSSRSLYLQTYDYRNLLTESIVAASASSGAKDTLSLGYDQSHRRIMKVHWYQFWDTCSGGGPPPGQMGPMGPGGPGQDTCLKVATSETYYLYDEGLLLATFDGSDNVRDNFINGPIGRIATYQFNDNNKLYYYLNDHLGSARGIMSDGSSPQLVYYAHFYPFGGNLELWTSSLSNQYRYTGKERDEHSTFDFHYFGERYYDTRIGQFTSFDKASQFPGGYRYGNNPIMWSDPDGNFGFLIPIIVAAAYGAGASALTYTLVAGASGQDLLSDEFWKGFGNAALTGAVGGTVGAGLGFIPGSISNNAAFDIFSNISGQAAGSFAAGNDLTLGSLAGSVGGSLAAGKLIGNFRATSSSPWANAGKEIIHSSVRGAVSGSTGGILANLIDGRKTFSNFGNNIVGGLKGGAASAIVRDALFGLPLSGPTTKEGKERLARVMEQVGLETMPEFRTGGAVGYIARWFIDNPAVNILGRTNLMFETTDRLYVHETAHVLQNQRFGWSNIFVRAINEQSHYRNPPWEHVYKIPGTVEGTATFLERF